MIGLNRADQGYNATMFNKEIDAAITRWQRLGQTTLAEYTEIENNIRKHHLFFLYRVSKILSSVKKK